MQISVSQPFFHDHPCREEVNSIYLVCNNRNKILRNKSFGGKGVGLDCEGPQTTVIAKIFFTLHKEPIFFPLWPILLLLKIHDIDLCNQTIYAVMFNCVWLWILFSIAQISKLQQEGSSVT